MPLIKGRSKKAFSENVKTEMDNDKPQDQALAISYAVKRKAKKKKMADGGEVDSATEVVPDKGFGKIIRVGLAEGGEISEEYQEANDIKNKIRNRNKAYDEYHKIGKVRPDASGGQKRGPEGHLKYQEQAQNEKGVHTPIPYVTESPGAKGTSIAGSLVSKTHNQTLVNRGKQKHKDKLEEIINFPKPKLQGLYEGGEVSVPNQKRPMPENEYNDSMEISKNKGNKRPVDDQWTDNPTVAQAQKPSLVPLSRPKMAGSDAFSVRDRDDVDRDLMRMSSEAPASPEKQPRDRYNEDGPNRQGPPVSDMEEEHSTHRRPYAKGGQVEQSDYSSPENKYEHDFKSDTPSTDEGSSYARSRNEEGPNRQGPAISDREASHSMSSRQYKDSMSNQDHEMDMNPAQGHYSASSGMYQPSEEEAEERHSSIAAAIMAKKERQSKLMSDSDMDRMVMMAEGGEINGMDSIYPHNDEDQADLSRNAEEDANLEDQASFDALRKENYSESEGLKQLDSPMDSAQKSDDEEMDSHDKHDMVSSIRSKMKAKRQFKK